MLAIDYVFIKKPLPIPQWLAAGHAAHWAAESPAHGLVLLAIGMIILNVAGIVISWIRTFNEVHLNYRLAASIRQKLYEHLSILSLPQLAEYQTGGIISRVMGDTDQVVGGVHNTIIGPTGSLFRILFILLILVISNWKLFTVAAIMIPAVVIIHFFVFRRLRPLWKDIQNDKSLLCARINNMFCGIQVVRGFRRERSEAKSFGTLQNTMVRKQFYASIKGRLMGTGWSLLVPAVGIFILWYGGSMVLHDQLKIGELVMFEGYSMMLLNPITELVDSLQNVQQNLGAIDRVCDVLGRPPDMPDRPNASRVARSRGSIEFRNVGFAYQPGVPVIIGCNLRIAAGAVVAVVGSSGSGKSTLANLLSRFYDVGGGQILLDNIDIRDIRLADYRRQLAIVPQDVYLFDGTIVDNIAFGLKHAAEGQIVAAAKQANAHDFITALPDGYLSRIGERGNKLSGGEKQRISLARAILANPRIMILDEATSALDSLSEKLIQASMEILTKGRTTIIIAHRLSTVMHADCIVVLAAGKIVEKGQHGELLRNRGLYHSMFTAQFDGSSEIARLVV
ncbi:MAG: ABC transporter ATP-binding protein [Phycisphaerae bacterium]